MNSQTTIAPHEYDITLHKGINLSDEDTAKIRSCFKPISVKKNEILLKEGRVCDTLYFITKGGLRTYYVTVHGSEKTRYIAFEGSFVTGLASFISTQPSFEYVDAIEDCELLAISRDEFYDLLNEVKELNLIYRHFIEQAYIHQARKAEKLVTLSARQRYDTLLKENPTYIQRVSNKVLASYLDVAPETLSRMKNK